MQSALALPNLETEAEEIQQEQHGRLYHVVLLDDDEHTYDYVIEMLQQLFFLSLETALQHAIEVEQRPGALVVIARSEYARKAEFDPRPENPRSSAPIHACRNQKAQCRRSWSRLQTQKRSELASRGGKYPCPFALGRHCRKRA